MGIDISTLIGSGMLDFSVEAAERNKVASAVKAESAASVDSVNQSNPGNAAPSFDIIHIGDMARSLWLYGKNSATLATHMETLKAGAAQTAPDAATETSVSKPLHVTI